MYEGGQLESLDVPPQPNQSQLLTFAEGNDPEVTLESIHNLGQRVKQCAKHLQYGKLLIQNYKNVFQDEISAMKDGRAFENEIYIRNYQSGI